MEPSWKKIFSKLSLVDDVNSSKEPPARKRVDVPISRPIQYEPSSPQFASPTSPRLVQNNEGAIYRHDTIVEQQTQIQKLREEKQLVMRQKSTISEQFLGAQILATHHEERIRNLNWQLEEEKEKLVSMTSTCNAKSQEISTMSNSVKILNEQNQRLQSRVAGLEKMLAAASHSNGKDLQSIYDCHSQLEATHADLRSKFTAEREIRQKLEKCSEASKSEAVHSRAAISKLEKEMANVDLIRPQDLRSLLVLRAWETMSKADVQDEEADSNEDFKSRWVPVGLQQRNLDEICSLSEIQELAIKLPKGPAYDPFYNQLSLFRCTVCCKSKFLMAMRSPASKEKSSRWLNEYLGDSKYFTCCWDQVCKDCFRAKLLESLASEWWSRLGSLQWLSCPRPSCVGALDIRCEADFQICLERDLGIIGNDFVKMYVKACAFRDILKSLDPRPSGDALEISAEVTKCLIDAGVMYSPFDNRFDVALVDETGCIPDFNPGTIYNAIMDRKPSPIPLFMKFFKRQQTSKECMACSKSMFEIDYGGVDAWKATCDDFQGSWQWNILIFPTKESQNCDHDFDICRACTAEHIRNTLVSCGPSACENLKCPQCNRKLTHQEILKLADTDTVAKYEKFLLQSFLSKEENFRWCLNPTCQNGELYSSEAPGDKIYCGECNFKMCFKHQVPWHKGQTCAQYDSERDPSFAKSHEWVKSNTKNCPNRSCRANIQKGEYCFHMTCSICSHEFCWECLADWDEIRVYGRGRHKEGCFFQTSEVGPMGLRGENIEQALRSIE
ncbi:hypothetical protein B0J14DRAFT_292216 [Halenospora varia]|nr:hypothetical protein B0J14DRAFT_292216 [Halenospora varia]